ncbi:MAG: hypothetical protein K1X94_03720, partial [Sandaracinaceae bacterium]|nr:hypothetical protein [Sandaracinaceae bacterium]
ERAIRGRVSASRQGLGALAERLALEEPRARVSRDRLALQALVGRLGPLITRRLEHARRALEVRAGRGAPLLERAAERDRRRLDALVARLSRAMAPRLAHARRRFSEQLRALDALSPLAVLERGYAIATVAETGRAVRDAAEVPAGTRLRVRVARGELSAEVLEKE